MTMILDSSRPAVRTTAEERPLVIEPFRQTLSKHDLKLVRQETTTLQINVGLLCNQACLHCHLSAGPGRKENMNSDIADEVVAYARRTPFETIDITGGAPELNPNLISLIERLKPLAPRLMVRSNLSALNEDQREHLFEFYKDHQLVIIASFPSINENQTEAQRGSGVFHTVITALKRLNAIGYGQPESGLELNLVSNPTGAFLPASQAQVEKRFRQVLFQKWGIEFNNLYNFGNVPLGRFRQWLLKSNNFEGYMQKLVSSFNPCAVDGVMCRTMISVAWDGYLYDCDFNIAGSLFMGGRKTHISE
ncbi:MAG: arsenosugar biosynthesis radical SAM protein ArsS, partial [Deltaproteobacteria bacterium]|nr:arsenosugar biosynthesis radical SAM protein ArsS [Deltaproteobacteria bacterium]